MDNKSKEAVLQSLDHTIAFYNATNAKEVQKLLENLKNNVNESFMIVPVYNIDKLASDHVHCLLIHKKNDQYVVTKTDKLHNINSFGNLNEYANFYTNISENKLPALSQVLFLSKQEHHEVKPYYQALWQIYEERKDKAHCENLWQEHCQEKAANGEKYIKKDKETMDRFLANHFVNKVLALPDTPEFIKHTENLRAKGEVSVFQVFTSDSDKLKKWDSEKFIKHVSNTNRTKQSKRRFGELLPDVSENKSSPTTQRQVEGPSR